MKGLFGVLATAMLALMLPFAALAAGGETATLAQADMKGKKGEAAVEPGKARAEQARERESLEAGQPMTEPNDRSDEEADKPEKGEKADKAAGKGRQDGKRPPGLEKKDGAPQAGKGSETGQQKREEKSRGWWKFWD